MCPRVCTIASTLTVTLPPDGPPNWRRLTRRSVALIVPAMEGDECGFTFASTLAVGGPRGQVLQQAHQYAHQTALSTNNGTSAGAAADMHAVTRTSAQAMLSMKASGHGEGLGVWRGTRFAASGVWRAGRGGGSGGFHALLGDTTLAGVCLGSWRESAWGHNAKEQFDGGRFTGFGGSRCGGHWPRPGLR